MPMSASTMSGSLGAQALDGLLAVADGDHLHVFIRERELDDSLNGDAVVGKEKLVGISAIRAPHGACTLRPDEVDDFLHGRAGQEDALDADLAAASGYRRRG